MRVLVVDDHMSIREIVTHVLTGIGFKVDSTGNGTKALQMFRSRHYDLVITDFLHPGLNGAELIGKIRRLKPWHPVLLFTASPIPTLAKPCELRDLATAARILTERKKKLKKARLSRKTAMTLDELIHQLLAFRNSKEMGNSDVHTEIEALHYDPVFIQPRVSAGVYCGPLNEKPCGVYILTTHSREGRKAWRKKHKEATSR